ncbi:hypothetical protein GCM10009665_49280 [Kitasatospora nipponensis]|uniref:Uncharacterized protein n=1 Tax=Kitasatospora nipponensis TaxID=258049 RepID=A0ABN1WJR7_9ACTN
MSRKDAHESPTGGCVGPLTSSDPSGWLSRGTAGSRLRGCWWRSDPRRRRCGTDRYSSERTNRCERRGVQGREDSTRPGHSLRRWDYGGAFVEKIEHGSGGAATLTVGFFTKDIFRGS